MTDIEGLHSKIDMDVEDAIGHNITLEESRIIGVALRLVFPHLTALEQEIAALRGASILQPMETAPKDGTVILILFRHMNYQYADDDEERAEWQGLCEAKWIDHNGGGWTWHGIAGEAIGWMPKPKSHYTNAATIAASRESGE